MAEAFMSALRCPSAIDLKKATRQQLVEKLAQYAKFVVECSKAVKEHQAEIERLNEAVEMTTKHAAQQALEMIKQDMFYSEEMEKLNDRLMKMAESLDRIEKAVIPQSKPPIRQM